MPKRMTYEEFMDDPFTRRILKRFDETGKRILRRNVIWNRKNERPGESMTDKTLQSRLDRFCEEGVLEKTDKDGNRIEGGKKAPATYYKLLAKHQNVAIKAADIERLRAQSPYRLHSGTLTTIYGFDETDLDEDEEDQRAFLEVLEMMDLLALRLLKLKVKALQRTLDGLSSALGDEFDPIASWLIRLYTWLRALAPFMHAELGEPEEFLFTIQMLAAQRYALDETIDDLERSRIAESVGMATVLAAWEHIEIGDLIGKIGEKSLSGMAVVHIAPTLGESLASLDRLEERFERFVRSEGEVRMKGDTPLFEWLQDLIPDEDDQRHPHRPLRATIRRNLGKAPDEVKKRLVREARETQERFAKELLDTKLLEPPRMPTIEDMREYWGHRDTQT